MIKIKIPGDRVGPVGAGRGDGIGKGGGQTLTLEYLAENRKNILLNNN